MKEKLNILIFLSALALLFVAVILLPPDSEAPEYENRAMAEMPVLSMDTLRSGGFFNDLETFLSDKTAYRTSLLRFSTGMELVYGVRGSGGAIMVDTPGDGLGLGLIPDVEDEDLYIRAPGTTDPSPSAGETQQPEEPPGLPGADVSPPLPTGGDGDTQTPPHSGDQDPENDPQPAAEPDTGPGTSGEADSGTPSEDTSAQQSGNRVDPAKPFSVDVDFNENVVFYERYREKSRTAQRYATILNSYLNRLSESVRVFSMLAPIRVEFMGEGYAASNDSQLETINRIGDLLDERIIRTATYDYLAAHADEYIYFRTDHHWTALGSYYAYLSFAQAAGFEPIGIDNYIEQSIPGFLGSFARGTQNKTTREHPDTIYYYQLDNGTTFSRRMFVIPDDMSRLSYRVFMGGDYAKLDFTSTNLNGKTLVIVKDSYANALIPWLSPHYERIVVIDPRQYGGSVTKLIGDMGDADLLFMNYIAATAMADFVETINNIK